MRLRRASSAKTTPVDELEPSRPTEGDVREAIARRYHSPACICLHCLALDFALWPSPSGADWRQRERYGEVIRAVMPGVYEELASA